LQYDTLLHFEHFNFAPSFRQLAHGRTVPDGFFSGGNSETQGDDTR
jgi:hypothetical protein